MADTKKTWPRTLHTLEKPGTPDTALKKRKAYLPLHQTQQQKHILLETKITLRIPYKAGREPVQQLYVRILNAVTFLAWEWFRVRVKRPSYKRWGNEKVIFGASQSMKKLISGLNPNASVSLATWNRGYKKFNSWWAAGWFSLKASPLFSIWRGSKKWKSPCSSWPLHIWVLSRAVC